MKDTKPRAPISYNDLREVFEQAQQKHEAKVEFALDWLRDVNGIAPILDKQFKVGWGNRLERDVRSFLPVVVEAGGSIGEAIDHLLQTKVLRKLKDRHDVRPKALEDFRGILEKLWKRLDGTPERSLDLLDRELRAKKNESTLASPLARTSATTPVR